MYIRSEHFGNHVNLPKLISTIRAYIHVQKTDKTRCPEDLVFPAGLPQPSLMLHLPLS